MFGNTKSQSALMAGSIILLTACGGGGGGGGGTTTPSVSDQQLTTVTRTIGGILDTEIQTLDTEITEFSQALGNGNCDALDLNDLRTAWTDVMTAWMPLQYFSQGPFEETHIIQRWPAVTVNDDRIDILVTGNDPAAIDTDWFNQEVVLGSSNGINDFHTVEYLLFNDAQNVTNNARACDLAQVVSGFVQNWADNITTESAVANLRWFGDDGFRNTYLSPAADRTALTDLQQDWLTDYVRAFEDIKKQKLEDPLGWDEGACRTVNFQPAPLSVETRYANVSMQLLFTQLADLKNKYEAAGSYRTMLNEGVSPGLATTIDQWFATALAQQATLEDVVLDDFILNVVNPVNPTVDGQPQGDEYVALLRLHQAVRNLTTLFKTDLAGILDVTISFNAADGDSGRPTNTNCWPDA